MDRIWEAFIGRKEASFRTNERMIGDEKAMVIWELGIPTILFVDQQHSRHGRKRTYSTFYR